MTPVKSRDSMLSLPSADDSAVTMMEDASVLSSPQSGRRTSVGTSNTPRTNTSDEGRQSRFSFSTNNSGRTPNSRRFFDEGGGCESCDDHNDAIPRFSPRRQMLHPLDLNHDLTVEGSVAVASTAAPSKPQQAYSIQCRKRTSGERQGPRLDSMMDASPHLSPHSYSPNSFRTMDGRFVQSKNPFSSPMVTEEETLYAGPSHHHAAPSMPINFGDTGKLTGMLLPPRGLHGAPPFVYQSAAAASSSSLSSGYPDRRFSFTGSPIQENEMAESSETASGGSLHKVRRFNRSDDVVAASSLHLSNRLKELAIETAANNRTNAMNSNAMMMSDEISPTEVINFPPPTPVKAKPSRAPYASIRSNEPTTPIAERRRRNIIAARTPHPGSFMHGHGYEYDDDGDGNNGDHQTNSKSRFFSDFDVIGELGKGSFGTVYKVLSRLDGCMYAIKAAQRKAKGVSDRDRMLKEVYALAALSDQADPATFHIVRYHQAWMEDDRLYIQTELCSGTLADDSANGLLTEPRRFKVLREMLLALDFIHRQQMVHLDIKPENIFLKNDQFKLGDFGLVSRANNRDAEEGDSRYMSMELLSSFTHSDLTKSDIFSLGATLYEICLGRNLPMNGQEWHDIRSGRLHPLPSSSPQLAEIIRQMMDPGVETRPSASQLLTYPQLLSDEQKALHLEKTRVIQLEAQAKHLSRLGPAAPPPKRSLMRANTWSGSSLPYL